MFTNFRKRIINSLYGAAFSTVVSLIGWLIAYFCMEEPLLNYGFLFSSLSHKTGLVIFLRLLACLLIWCLLFLSEKRWHCILTGVACGASFFNFFDLFIPKYLIDVNSDNHVYKQWCHWCVLDYIRISRTYWNLPDFLIMSSIPAAIISSFI